MATVVRADTTEEGIAQRRKRGEIDKRKAIRIGTFNVGSITGESQEFVDFMEWRK